MKDQIPNTQLAPNTKKWAPSSKYQKMGPKFQAYPTTHAQCLGSSFPKAQILFIYIQPSLSSLLFCNKNLNAIINLENTKEAFWEAEKCISIHITFYKAGKKSLKAKAHKILLENAC